MRKIVIGHLSTFYHTSTVLMADRDFPEQLGRDVEWRLFGTGPAIVDAFDRKELDLAYIGLPPAVIGISRGVEIVCIAGGHIEGTVISGKKTFRGFPEIGDFGGILEQFRGFRIGVPGKGSIHDVILSESLERFHLKGEIGVINFRWADEITEAAAKEEVVCAVGTPALAVALNRYAEGKVLFPPSRIWPNNPSYGILADRNFLQEEKETAEKFLGLHEEAAAFLRNSPEKAAKAISGYVGFIGEDFVLETLKISPKYCSALTKAYIGSTMEFVGILRRLGYIDRDVSEEEIFDTSLIAEVHPSEAHYENP